MVSGRWAKPTLVGELVTLRPLVASDADAMWEAAHDPEGRDLTAATATFERSYIDAWCASRQDQDERLDLAIVEHATGEFAGEAVLNEFDPETNSANFRIGLRGPAWYGRKLGGEATRMIVRHGLTPVAEGGVGLSSITLTVLARNPRAIAAYVRAGFVEEQRFFEDGEHWVPMRNSAAGSGVDGHMTFPEAAMDLLAAPITGMLSTITPDGHIQTTAIWHFLDDDGQLKFSLANARKKTRNLLANPTATYFLLDPANPFHFVEVRGQVTLVVDEGFTFRDRVGAKYGMDLSQMDTPEVVRYVVTMQPAAVNAQ